MDDLISRNAVLSDIDEEIEANQEYPEDKLIRKGLRIARKCIENAPAVNRWIPVEDALPDALQNVLVCTDISTVTVAWINGEGWTFADTGNGHTEDWSFEALKYWMNLPEPPKSEQK
jgi:hypothetical protein